MAGASRHGYESKQRNSFPTSYYLANKSKKKKKKKLPSNEPAQEGKEGLNRWYNKANIRINSWAFLKTTQLKKWGREQK